MKSCGRTVTLATLNALSYALDDQEVVDVFAVSSCPASRSSSMLLPSLRDQPLQSVHPHLDQVLQGGAGTTGLMEKKLRAARVSFFMFWEYSWLAAEARSLFSYWDILSHLLPGFSLWKEFFCRFRSFNTVFPKSTIVPILEYLAVLLVPHY